MKHSEAQALLTAKNMVLLKFSLPERREYWGFKDMNVLLDHSATITWVGGTDFHVSDFSDSPAKYPYQEPVLEEI